MSVGRSTAAIVLFLAAFLGGVPLRVCAAASHARVMVAGELFHGHPHDDDACEHETPHAARGCSHGHGHAHGHDDGAPLDQDGETPEDGDHCHCGDTPLELSQEFVPVQLDAPSVAFALPVAVMALSAGLAACSDAAPPREPPLLPALIGSTVLLR